MNPGPPMNPGQWTLYYDGGCNLCEAAQTIAGRWALKSEHPLRILMIQSPEAAEAGVDPDLMTVDTPDGRFTAADAWLQLMRIGPVLLRPVALMRKTRPTLWLARTVYNFVAARRKKWFGTRECRLPSASR